MHDDVRLIFGKVESVTKNQRVQLMPTYVPFWKGKSLSAPGVFVSLTFPTQARR